MRRKLATILSFILLIFIMGCFSSGDISLTTDNIPPLALDKDKYNDLKYLKDKFKDCFYKEFQGNILWSIDLKYVTDEFKTEELQSCLMLYGDNKLISIRLQYKDEGGSIFYALWEILNMEKYKIIMSPEDTRGKMFILHNDNLDYTVSGTYLESLGKTSLTFEFNLKDKERR